jgi:hypothetical protein
MAGAKLGEIKRIIWGKRRKGGREEPRRVALA